MYSPALAINPLTGTNWEGTGIIPDKEVPQESALQVAHLEAVEKVLETLSGKIPAQAYRTLEKEAHLLLKGFLSIDDEEK